MNRIAADLADHFERAWAMYEEAAREIPDGEWRSDGASFVAPCRHVMHAVETAEYYSGAHPNVMEWGERFGGDWLNMPEASLPTGEAILPHIQAIRVRVDAWIRGMSDEDLLSPERAFPGTGDTILGRVLYLLRHHQAHVGEINADLRTRGLPRIEWR